MELRAGETELYAGRPSWRALMSFYVGGIGLAVDRMLGVGTVDFDTAGTDDSEFRFEWVNGPEDVVRAVDHATEEAWRVGATRPRQLVP